MLQRYVVRMRGAEGREVQVVASGNTANAALNAAVLSQVDVLKPPIQVLGLGLLMDGGEPPEAA